jgi:CRISPR-associated protein Cst2
LTATDSYFHVKYASERSASQRQTDTAEEARGANLGQAIFHRPASSGVYAVVTTLELARIGFNDITQLYAISDEERLARHVALLESVLYTFLEPNGAMRSTQNPHIVGFDGVVAVSKEVVPAPTLSPLGGDFVGELQRVQAALDSMRPGAVVLYPFKSLGEFTEVMANLVQTTEPLKLAYAA